MTTAAICATREVSWRPSYYRGEQYDQDLGLYYLRARYYNPATGRFLSRDPEGGKSIDPKTLHKYLYVGGNPVNWIDPRGREIAIEEAGVDSEEDLAAAKEAREVGYRLAGCYLSIAATMYYIAKEEGKDAVLAGLILYFGCREFWQPEPPMPSPVPPTPWPEPPPPQPPINPGQPLPPGCSFDVACWNPPPGAPIN